MKLKATEVFTIKESKQAGKFAVWFRGIPLQITDTRKQARRWITEYCKEKNIIHKVIQEEYKP